jgi:hypothetical protein
MNSELFKRFVGSAPGYEKRPEPVATTNRTVVYPEITSQEPPANAVLVPQIRAGRIIGWTTLS